MLPFVRRSIAEHRESCGSWRLPAFEELAQRLIGDKAILDAAGWCHETCIAITRDGRESDFFIGWANAAEFLQTREVYSGEGGAIGLAAAYAGWPIDYEVLTVLGEAIQHEGGGPKLV